MKHVGLGDSKGGKKNRKAEKIFEETMTQRRKVENERGKK